jgi:UDP-sugar transporter A1/2/3
MHYSRVVPVVPGHRYLPSTAVLLVEVLKLVVSLSIALYQLPEYRQSGPSSKLFMSLYSSIFSSDSWKLVIPAALYTLQNSLVYIAISNLSAASFQVTYQLKILTTVLFSIILLGKRITSRQWLALVLLTIGVAIVQTGGELPTNIGSLADLKARISTLLLPAKSDLSSAAAEASKLSESFAARLQQSGPDSDVNILVGPIMDASKGLLAVVAASLTSGLTGVYFEKVIKDSLSTVSLWTRNVQLSFFSLFPALIIGVWWQDGREIYSNGFFVGYNWIVWTTIALQAFGGIMVAVCITYADNIAKNFAASFSIVLSCMLSAMFFESPLTVNFTMGTAIVLLAVYLYQSRDRTPTRLILPLTTPGGAINLR